MGKISKKTRMKNYFKIFEQIYEFPTMSLNEIAATTELSRNTVSKYLKEMYARNILVGPHLRVNPHANYKEYVYLMNFSDPWMVFKGLKGFPHVLYHAVAFGDWNTMVITNNPLDFSQLVGFHNVVYQGIRYCSYTPKPAHTTWDESLKKVCQQIAQGTPARIEYKSRKVAPLTWQEDEWKLFHIFKYNMRQKVTPPTKKDQSTVRDLHEMDGDNTRPLYYSYRILPRRVSKLYESLFFGFFRL
ncbi:MAG: winged helix-turn-helix transcriptional regulator [Theionarchaea archaeon]|nr:winged helix-turn-helix transcriptional regulator [Theionarchaea archaeon]